MGSTQYCFADGEMDYGNKLKTYVSDNTTGVYANTNVSITTIRPGIDKILGFSVQEIDTGASEIVAVLYDAVSGDTLNNSNLMGEAESIVDSFNGLWFPYPITLTNGLSIRQGGYTRVIVSYTTY